MAEPQSQAEDVLDRYHSVQVSTYSQLRSVMDWLLIVLPFFPFLPLSLFLAPARVVSTLARRFARAHT